MAFDTDEFCSEAETFFEHESHKKYVEATLPNKGDSVEDICRKGFAQFERNFEKLYSELSSDETAI